MFFLFLFRNTVNSEQDILFSLVNITYYVLYLTCYIYCNFFYKYRYCWNEGWC